MARYIDADELLKRLQFQQKYGSTQDSKGRAKAILEVIQAPTGIGQAFNPDCGAKMDGGE